LPTLEKVSAHVTLWQPSGGGHAGFASGSLPGHLKAMPQAVGQWLLQHIH
jgi:predicted alpha/beta-fold hydrolase